MLSIVAAGNKTTLWLGGWMLVGPNTESIKNENQILNLETSQRYANISYI